MKRIPESELMDDPEQARAYAQADFTEPHEAFIALYRRCFAGHAPGRVLDLGCGAADISIRFARAHPACVVTGVDGAEAMLALGRHAVRAAGLADRIELCKLHLPAVLSARAAFDTLISNSLLHHLADPMSLWDAVRHHGERNAAVFLMDLLRPASLEVAGELVKQHCGGEPEILQRDFFNSLRAAYLPREVRTQLIAAGLGGCLQVQVVSDRHLIIWGCLP